jgi:hypothetical protein
MDSLSGFADSIAAIAPLIAAALVALAATFWIIRSRRRGR